MFSDEYRILYVCGQSVLKLTFGNANKGWTCGAIVHKAHRLTSMLFGFLIVAAQSRLEASRS